MDKILWADDEIDLLKPHILFLKAKGYDVTTVSNGRDAIDALDREPFSLVLLDENMPGISGLETLDLINLQVVQLRQLIKAPYTTSPYPTQKATPPPLVKKPLHSTQTTL